MNYEELMRRAIDLARQAEGFTEHYPMVGAVLVKNGKIISEDYFQRPGEMHAEAKAISKAGLAAKGATLVLNLEPCSHQGRQPPCADAVVKAGIKTVVAAMTDPNPLVSGRGFRKLRAAGIEVIKGVLENEARLLNRYFVKFMTTGTPWVVQKLAATADGKLADRERNSKWITSEASRLFVHHLRSKAQVVMAGIGTVLQDDPQLNARVPGQVHQPRPLIVDEKLRIPVSAQVFGTAAQGGAIIACVKSAPAKKIKQIEKIPAQVIVTRMGKGGQVDLKDLLQKLGKNKIASVLCEGGSHLAGSMLEQGLVDEIMFFIAPKLLLDEKALPIITGSLARKITETIPLYKTSMTRIGPDFLFNALLREI